MEGDRIAADDFAAVVRQLYRMFKTGTIHLMNNEAVTQAIGQAVKVVSRLKEQGVDEISLLFLNDTVFVNGTLLKAGREIYEAALDLGVLLRRAGANEMSVSTEATVEELSEVVRYASGRMRSDVHDGQEDEPLPRFSEGASLRLIDPALLEDVQTGSMTARDRLGRTYASTLVVMRFLYDGLKEGRYGVSRQLKRLTQQLVLLADEDPKAFLGLTRMRNVQDDEAGRAVNSAILAILAVREVTSDVRTVSRVALSALMADIGRPRAAGMGRGSGSNLAVIPVLSEEQQRRLPRATVVAVAAVGRLHDEALHRTVVGYEAQWLANKRLLGELYEGEYLPHLESTLVFMVRRFNELITYDVYSQSRMAPDDAMRVLRRTASDEPERRCADLLFQALGLVPRGSVVELSSGHLGVVLENSDKPGLYGLPSVQVFADKNGERVNGILVDLAKPSRDVLRYGGIQRVRDDLESPSDLPQVEHSALPEPRVVSKPSARKRALPDSIRRRVANDSNFELDDDIVVEVTGDFDGPRLEFSDDIEVVPLETLERSARDIASTTESGASPALQFAMDDFVQVAAARRSPASTPPLPGKQQLPPTIPERVGGDNASAPHPAVGGLTREVTPTSNPSHHPSISAEGPRASAPSSGERELAHTPSGLPAVTTGALPVVGEVPSRPQIDAADELDSMLESYFGSPPKRSDDDDGLPGGVHLAEHSLPGEGTVGAAPVAPTGPLPIQSADATGDLSEPVAHNLLRSYFPDSEVPKRSELSQAFIPRASSSGPEHVMPRTTDIQVENAPNPHQNLSSHFPDTAAAAESLADSVPTAPRGPMPIASPAESESRLITPISNSPNIERSIETLSTEFDASIFDSILTTDTLEMQVDAPLVGLNDVPGLDDLIPQNGPPPALAGSTQARHGRPPTSSAPEATPEPKPSNAELDSLLSSYLKAAPTPPSTSAQTENLLAAYLSEQATAPKSRRAIVRRKPKLGVVVERTSGVSRNGEARRVRTPLNVSHGKTVAGPPLVQPAEPKAFAEPVPVPRAETPPHTNSTSGASPIANFADLGDANSGLEALRNYADGDVDDAPDSIRASSVSFAGEIGNDDPTPPPAEEPKKSTQRSTMFGSPGALGLEELADTAPDARPVPDEQGPTVQTSGQVSRDLLSSFDTPGAQRAVAATRPSSALAATPVPEPRDAPTPPPTATPQNVAAPHPDLGLDTTEVDDAHANAVLRDFLRDRSAPPAGPRLASEKPARPDSTAPMAPRAEPTPPIGTTVEMGAAAADALLDAYSGSRETVPNDEEQPQKAGPQPTREVGSRRASDLLSRYVKPDEE